MALLKGKHFTGGWSRYKQPEKVSGMVFRPVRKDEEELVPEPRAETRRQLCKEEITPKSQFRSLENPFDSLICGSV